MTKEYQRKYNNPYLLPKTLYNRTLGVIRDYERMKSERNDILHGGSCAQDGLPRGSGLGNPTESKALKLEQISRDMEAVEQALLLVEDDLRDGVMNNICYWIGYPRYPSRWTWQRAKQKFIHQTAINLKLI